MLRIAALGLKLANPFRMDQLSRHEISPRRILDHTDDAPGRGFECDVLPRHSVKI